MRTLVNIDELFQLDGVIAVAKLDDMGRIVDWKAKGAVSTETKNDMNKMLMELNNVFDRMSREAPRNWAPRKSLIYTGGDMTLIVASGVAVTAETKKLNPERLFKNFGDVLGFR